MFPRAECSLYVACEEAIKQPSNTEKTHKFCTEKIGRSKKNPSKGGSGTASDKASDKTSGDPSTKGTPASGKGTSTSGKGNSGSGKGVERR